MLAIDRYEEAGRLMTICNSCRYCEGLCAVFPAMELRRSFAAAELKTIQELITLAVFCVFSVAYLDEPLRWNVLVGFALIAAGAAFVFKPW